MSQTPKASCLSPAGGDGPTKWSSGPGTIYSCQGKTNPPACACPITHLHWCASCCSMKADNPASNTRYGCWWWVSAATNLAWKTSIRPTPNPATWSISSAFANRDSCWPATKPQKSGGKKAGGISAKTLGAPSATPPGREKHTHSGAARLRRTYSAHWDTSKSTQTPRKVPRRQAGLLFASSTRAQSAQEGRKSAALTGKRLVYAI